MKRRFLVSSSLVLSSMFFSACDVVKDTLGVPNRMPVIASFDYNPKNGITKNDIITFSVVANDPEGKPLQYNWTATKGMLTANAGNTTSWRPFKQDSSPEYGLSVVSVVISDGVMTNTASVNIFVNQDGSISVNQVSNSSVPSATPSITVSTSPSPVVSPSNSPAPSATPSITVSASPSPVVSPSNSAVPSATPSITVSASPSPVVSPSNSPVPTPSASISSSPSPSAMAKTN